MYTARIVSGVREYFLYPHPVHPPLMAHWTYIFWRSSFSYPLSLHSTSMFTFSVCGWVYVESNNGAKARNERLYYGCGAKVEWVSVVFLLLPHIHPAPYLSPSPIFPPSYRRCRRWNSEWVSRWRKMRGAEWESTTEASFPTPLLLFLKYISSHLSLLSLMLYTKSTNITLYIARNESERAYNGNYSSRYIHTKKSKREEDEEVQKNIHRVRFIPHFL